MKPAVTPYRWSTRIYLLGTLAAVELLMSFSFLGYFHVEPLSITFAYLPVLLAGLIGLPEAVILGTVFGLASMWKAGAHYVLPFDQLFSPLISGHPLESILLSVGSRALFGLVVGLMCMAARHLRWTGLWIGVTAFLGKTIHALLVYTALNLFFPETGYHPGDAWTGFFSWENLAGNLVITAAVLLVWRLEQSRMWQRFRTRAEKVRNLHMEDRYHRLSLVLILVLCLGLALAVAVYFVHRMDYVLQQQGISLTGAGYSDLLHLQIQFLIGILSMMALVIIFLIFNRRYATYLNYEARTDAITGAMTRKTFFQTCGRMLKELRSHEGPAGYFMMVDLDYFKQINDQYGHPEGDLCLKSTAQALREVFGEECLIGRVGGDEFAVLVTGPVPQEQLEQDLRFFLDQIHSMGTSGHRLSCSIGVVPALPGSSADALYHRADRMLYQAKQAGRGRFVIGTPEEAETEAEK